MEDFNKAYDKLRPMSKRELSVNGFSFSRKGFDITLSPSVMQKITKADIIVFNGKTKQYRTFRYSSYNERDGMMIFKCGDIMLTIRKG